MNIYVPKKSCLLSMLFSVMLSATASAHTLWINCTDYTPNFSVRSGAKTKIYMGWGHHFPVDSFVKAEDFTDITVMSPSAKTENVTLETTGFAAKQLSLKEEGLYIIAVTRKDAYNTSYRENGKVVLAKGTKEGRKDVVSSTYSQQFAKSLVLSGNGNVDNLSHAFGHKLEIIPLTNPYGITNNRGGEMLVKVLFNGKPVQHKKVYAMYEGYSTNDDASCTVSTNEKGIAKLRIDHWGPWVVKTKHELPASREMQSKVNQENYFASLTFSVP
ncbi:MAG: DUF4198 domain-containing protein [Acidaminococcaceae bacterium]|nr:DUF4198 domain-containing protein [Acidaminococcaceae bacterium]MBQ8491053.1 DUF4198 domain-containing protein [Acidaminococcaceae bacterium]